MSFNFMAVVIVCSDFGAQENKVFHCFHCFPIYMPWSDGTWCQSVFLMLSLLWLFIFLPAILIPACASSSPTFHMMYSAAKSLQSCPTLCNPIDSSPPGPTVPGILQARTLEWVAISSSNWCTLYKVK